MISLAFCEIQWLQFKEGEEEVAIKDDGHGKEEDGEEEEMDDEVCNWNDEMEAEEWEEEEEAE